MPLVNVNHLRCVPVNCARQRRAVPAGLLVGVLAGDEARHLDLLDERHRRERVGDLRLVVAVGADLLEQVDGLAVQRLVGLAGLVALLDALVRPGLALLLGGRLGVVDALLGPVDGEARVEHAARVERRLRRVEHRQRRDRGQARRLPRGGEQLADAAVGDAHHPDLAVRDPGLAGDRLDDVVAVEALQRLEEVERAAGAAGAAHVDVDDGEAHQVGEDRDPALRAGRVGVAVAGVLDQRRRRRGGRRAGQRDREWERRRARDVLRRVHVDRELGAVAGRQVPVAARGDRLAVAVRARRGGALGEHGQRPGLLAAALDPHAVPVARLDLAEDQAAEPVRARGPDRAPAGVQQGRARARREAGHVDLPRAAVRVDRGLRGARGGREHEREDDGGGDADSPRHGG